MKTLTLICGIPNAGKTTYSKRYDNVIHLDDVIGTVFDRKIAECSRIASEFDSDVCVEGCYYSSSHRTDLLNRFNGRGFRKVCVLIDTPLETCLSRSSIGRNKSLVAAANKVFQRPTKDEGWDDIIIVTPNEDRTSI